MKIESCLDCIDIYDADCTRFQTGIKCDGENKVQITFLFRKINSGWIHENKWKVHNSASKLQNYLLFISPVP